MKDIVIPDNCPVLGISLRSVYGEKQHDGSPTLDRFVPSLGYVKGNVSVISRKANTMKSNGSLVEILQLALWCAINMKKEP